MLDNRSIFILSFGGLACCASAFFMSVNFALILGALLLVFFYVLHGKNETTQELPVNFIILDKTGEFKKICPNLNELFTSFNGSLYDNLHPEDQLSFRKALEKNGTTLLTLRLIHSRPSCSGSLEQRVAWLEDALSDASLHYEITTYLECSFTPYNKDKFVLVRDITQSEKEQARIQSLQQQTARAQATKSRFLANITHELRTPLNAIIGFSQMLCAEKEMALNQGKRLEYATLIHEAGDHLLGIVNTILDMSKLESGKFELNPDFFSPRDLVENCHAIIDIKAKAAGVELHSHIEQALPEIQADKRACRQIMLNLLANAVKFTQSGGHVTTHLQRKGETLVISVADTGIGIANEDLPFIGEAFYQAKSNYDRPYEGTGLGLSVVKGLVHLHKGQFKITSTLGKGTIITVTLPLTQSVEEAEALPLARAA